MSELPEKLKQGTKAICQIINPDKDGYVLGNCNNPKLAAEIVKRYNAYPDQQALIKQLVKACKGMCYLPRFTELVTWNETRDLAKAALTAVEKMKGK